MSAKPKVAFFSFTGCEGCQLAVLELEPVLLDILGAVDIVSFREAMTEHSEDYEIAFVEGSISTPHDVEEVQHIRQRAGLVVAIGACACSGGLNALKNRRGMDDVLQTVYGSSGSWFETIPA
ncbi:MAG TPA: NADH:ubiquinone oxidoreductase, partial [Armatimonadota bacterium]|nr:NADH:ubiquinone oxidoreductase [Armatimonadota bacterium]